jgi:hypothetical protein
MALKQTNRRGRGVSPRISTTARGASSQSRQPVIPKVKILTAAEAHALFDYQARKTLNMSGEEFIQAWESGQFDEIADTPDVMHLVALLPFSRAR